MLTWSKDRTKESKGNQTMKNQTGDTVYNIEKKPKLKMMLTTLHLICVESLYRYRAQTNEGDGQTTTPSRCICYPPTRRTGYYSPSNKQVSNVRINEARTKNVHLETHKISIAAAYSLSTSKAVGNYFDTGLKRYGI
jgi:hypothetical protein